MSRVSNFLSTLRALGLLLFAGTLGCDQFLTITRVNEAFSNSNADTAIESANVTLQIAHGSNDFGCPVILRRSGDVVPVSGNNTIDTDAQLRTIFRVPGYVKVVHKINRCGRMTSAGIIGCASPHNMIVEDLKDNDFPNRPLEGILWAHEFGHTQGLPHRVVPTSCVSCEGGVCIDFCAGFPPDPFSTVMAPFIGLNNRLVSQQECSALLVPINAPVSCISCEGGVCIDFCSFGIGGSEPAPANARKAPIEEFVRRVYFDSMPFEEAMRYGPEEIPTLKRMLSDPLERASWPMVASVLGVIGDDASAHALIDFVVRERSGKMRGDMYRAVGSAIVALGYLVERSGSPTALEFLSQASEPGFWERQPRMHWTSSAGPTRAARNQRLADFAVMGLGLSGHREAMPALRRRWEKLSQRRATGSAQEQQAMQEVVEQAMDDHSVVTKHGLGRYYRNSHR